ncbi:endogenous retrovirus group K member 5 Gag polyprotein-like [Arvicola amphibius]|uniref:endogenous retrovirus group K member 5 Gag polyprotein-like n=1 Tax=Arvicola amphibius TaxID=1047088 RepID=UPI001C09B7E9|nr:endogenous retrovirus group K member 5 Gag polyprotein-like [Arvicola amphibius]
MEQGNSRQLFIHLIKDTLKARGAKVEQQQVQEFLEFVERLCPWFSKHRTLDADTWRRIGVKIQQHSNKHEPGKISVGAPSLWALIQDSLGLRPEGQKVFPPETVNSETKPSAPLEPLDADAFTELLDRDRFDPVEAEFEEEPTGYSNEKFSPPQIQTVNVKGQKPGDEIEEELKDLRGLVVSLSQKLESLQVSSQEGTPLPTVRAGLGPPGGPSVVQRLPRVWQALTVSHMSPLQASIKEAASRGEDVQGFQMFQVIEQRDAQGNVILVHVPILFKQLKELKMACSLYGPTAPFTTGLLEDIAIMILTPEDWKLIARACLSKKHYLLWKSEFMKQCKATAERNRTQQSSITFDMLAGEGVYQTTDKQLDFDPAVYAQVDRAAKMAWNRLPPTGTHTVHLSKIRQGPDELFQDFVSRLTEATSRLIGITEDRFIKVLAYENANAVCQAALRPHRTKGTISDYIRLCSDIGPSYTQGLAMAAALQGKTVKDILFQQRNQGLRQGRAVGSSGSCFGCGRVGHKVKQCPDERKRVGTKKEPGLCPKCKRGKHWANECRSKKDAHGNPLPGRGQRGLPQGPRSLVGGADNYPEACEQAGLEYMNNSGSITLEIPAVIAVTVMAVRPKSHLTQPSSCNWVCAMLVAA